MESSTRDSIMSGATSDQQESFSSSFRVAAFSCSGGDAGEKIGDLPEQRNAGRERERDGGRSEGKQVQTDGESARFGGAEDASLDSQSSAMASMLSMPSGPAPRRYTGCVDFFLSVGHAEQSFDSLLIKRDSHWWCSLRQGKEGWMLTTAQK